MSKPIEHLNKLFNHVRSGDINSIKLFMAGYGGDPNILSEEGLSLGTTVMRSKDMGTEEKKIAVLRTLHSLGVELSLPDMNMQTPFHLAAKDKMEKIFTFLLDNIPGFDSLLVQQDVMLKTPLEYLVLPGTESVTTYHASQLTDAPVEFFSTTAAVVPPKVVQEYAERIVGMLNDEESFVKQYIMPMMNKLGENLHARNLQALREQIHEVSHQIPGLLQSPADMELALEQTRKQLDDAVGILKSAFSGNRFASIPGMTSLSFFRPNMYDENFMENLDKRKTHLKDQYNILTEVEYKPYLGKYQGPVNSTQLHYPMILDYETMREYPRWNPLGEDEKKKLLSIMMTHPGAVLPRNHIINKATGYFIRGHNLTMLMRADEDHSEPIQDYTDAETILPVSEEVKQFYATNILFYEEKEKESLATNLYLGNMRYRYNGYQNIALQPDEEPHLLRHQNSDVGAFTVGLTPPDNDYKKLIDSIKGFSIPGAGVQEHKGGADLSAIDQFINAIGRPKFTIPSKGTREEKFDQMARGVKDPRLHPLLWEIIHQQETRKFDLNQIKRSVFLLVSANDFTMPSSTTRTLPNSQKYFEFIKRKCNVDNNDNSSTDLEIAMQKQRIHPTSRRLICDLNDILHDNNNLCIRDSFHDMEEISIVTMAAVRTITDAADTIAMDPDASVQDVMNVVRMSGSGSFIPNITVDIKSAVIDGVSDTMTTPSDVIINVLQTSGFIGSYALHKALDTLVKVAADCMKNKETAQEIYNEIYKAVYGNVQENPAGTIDRAIFLVYYAVAKVAENAESTAQDAVNAAIQVRPPADTLPLVTNAVLDSILHLIKAASRVETKAKKVLQVLAAAVSGLISLNEPLYQLIYWALAAFYPNNTPPGSRIKLLEKLPKKHNEITPSEMFKIIIDLRQQILDVSTPMSEESIPVKLLNLDDPNIFARATFALAAAAGYPPNDPNGGLTATYIADESGKYDTSETSANGVNELLAQNNLDPLSGLSELLEMAKIVTQTCRNKFPLNKALFLYNNTGLDKLRDAVETLETIIDQTGQIEGDWPQKEYDTALNAALLITAFSKEQLEAAWAEISKKPGDYGHYLQKSLELIELMNKFIEDLESMNVQLTTTNLDFINTVDLDVQSLIDFLSYDILPEANYNAQAEIAILPVYSCLASCAAQGKLIDSIIESFSRGQDVQDVIQMINQTVQAAEPINAQVQALLDTTKESAEASAQLQALKLHSKDPIQMAIEKKRADKKKKAAQAAQVGGASDDNPTLNEDYREEIKELFMFQTCLAYYQAESLGVEMIGDTCFEENYRVWSQREHDGNNADGPYGIMNHTPIDALQKHQISGEYLTIKSNAAFLSQGTVTKAEERYRKYTGDVKTYEIMDPPPVPQDVENYLRKHGKHTTQDDFPLDAKYADENPITFVHPSRFDVPLRVIERRIKKWEKRFNTLQRKLTDKFKSDNNDKDAIITCVAILQLMREIVNDIRRYVKMYELERRDLNRYIPNLMEKFPDQKPFWEDALSSSQRMNTDIEGRLANSLAIAEDLFTIYANINWNKRVFHRAFRSDLPFYPTIDLTDLGPNMELISVGDTLLGMWKEKWLFDMVDGGFEPTDRLRFYEIASNILSKWLDYAARFVVYNKVKGETKTLSSVFDNYLKPQMHITVEDIKKYYEKYSPQSESIHIMLSEDYDSLVPDWEFNQTFQVLDNTRIRNILINILNKWGKDNPNEWLVWWKKILSFFIDHFNDGFFDNISGTHIYRSYYSAVKLDEESHNLLTASLKEQVMDKLQKFQCKDKELQKQMCSIFLDTKKAIANVDTGFQFPKEQINGQGYDRFFTLLCQEKYRNCDERSIIDKNHIIQQHVIEDIETILKTYWLTDLVLTIQKVMGDAQIIDPNIVPDLPAKLVFAVLKLKKRDERIDDDIKEEEEDAAGKFIYPSDPEDYDVETVMEEVASRFNDENNVIRDRVIPYYKKLGELMVKDLHSIASNYLRYKIHERALEKIQIYLEQEYAIF